jgi:hypothetical protein
MRDLYSSHAAAQRHAVERGGMSSLGVLQEGVPSASTLTGIDATAQAARIRRQLVRLALLPRAAVRPNIRFRNGKTRCASPSRTSRPCWRGAAPTTSCDARSSRTRAKETAVSLAERRGVNRHTVAAHAAVIETDLTGNRREPGRLDHASERIDTLLREACIVTEASNDSTHAPAA